MSKCPLLSKYLLAIGYLVICECRFLSKDSLAIGFGK